MAEVVVEVKVKEDHTTSSQKTRQDAKNVATLTTKTRTAPRYEQNATNVPELGILALCAKANVKTPAR